MGGNWPSNAVGLRPQGLEPTAEITAGTYGATVAAALIPVAGASGGTQAYLLGERMEAAGIEPAQDFDQQGREATGARPWPVSERSCLLLRCHADDRVGDHRATPRAAHALPAIVNGA